MTSISDTNVVNAPGGLVELGYTQVTSNQTISSTSATSPTSTNISVTVVCDGSPIVVDFYCGEASPPQTNNGVLIAALWMDGAELDRTYGIAYSVGAGLNGGRTLYCQKRITPSAGVHTFNIRGWIANNGGNNGIFYAGTDVSGFSPTFIRVSKIIQASQLIVQTPNAPLVTSLPSNAIDGQEVRYLADNTNGIIWNFRYRAGSSSSYKWEFIGGSALRSSVASVGRQTNLNVFENLNGPTITVPLAGDYDLVAETGWNDAYDSVYLMQILAGSTGIQIARMRQIAYGGGEVVLTSRALAIAASTLIRPQYYIQVAQAVGYGWGASSIAATPIRVSA